MQIAYIVLSGDEEQPVSAVFDSRYLADRYLGLMGGSEVQEFPVNLYQERLEKGQMIHMISQLMRQLREPTMSGGHLEKRPTEQIDNG